MTYNTKHNNIVMHTRIEISSDYLCLIDGYKTNFNWETIGLKYVGHKMIGMSYYNLFTCDVVNKEKFLYAVLKYNLEYKIYNVY